MKAINKSLTLSSFPDWMISFLLPIYCTGLGFSPAQTTRMFAMHSLFLLLGKLVSGRLCDRVGRRVVFLAGLVLMSGAYLLLAFAQGAALLYSSQVLDGAASALLAVSAYAMLADRSGENMAIDRGRQSAASNWGALYGVFLYFMLLTWLGFGQGWKAFFLLCAVLTLLGAANNYKGLPADQGTAVQPSAPKMDWRALLASRVGGLLAVRTLMALALNMLGAVVVLVMMGRFGEDMMLIGLTCLLPSCLLTWLMPKIGAQVKRIGERKAFLCCGVLALFFLAFLANSRQPVSWLGRLSGGGHGLVPVDRRGVLLLDHRKAGGCFQPARRAAQRPVFLQHQSGQHDLLAGQRPSAGAVRRPDAVSGHGGAAGADRAGLLEGGRQTDCCRQSVNRFFK